MRLDIGLATLLIGMAVNGAAEEITVPFELDSRRSLVFVAARANGREAVLVVDTGASRTLLSYTLLDGERPRASRFAGDGPGLEVEAHTAVADLTVGPVAFPDRELAVADLGAVSRALGRRVDGILGQDLLREFDRVTIDYRARKLVLKR